jgi:hypothetical protein
MIIHDNDGDDDDDDDDDNDTVTYHSDLKTTAFPFKRRALQ